MESIEDIEGRRPSREERIAPHEIELIKYRSNQLSLQFCLLSGEKLEGKIQWYDDQAIKIIQSDQSEVTVLRQALAYYKTRS